VTSGERVRASPWRRRPDPVKTAALAISVALQFGLVAVISVPPASESDEGSHARDVFQVMFVVRSPGRRQPTMTEALVRHRRAHAPVPARDSERAARPLAQSNHPQSSAPLSVAELDLSLVAPPIDFHRNPLERPSAPLEAGRPRLEVTFADRSLGGALQALAQRRTCGELRAALVGHGESTTSITKAMRRYRCSL